MSHQSSPDAAVSGVTHWIGAKREEKAKNLEAQKLASEQAKQAAGIIPAIDGQWSPLPLPPQPLIVSQPVSDIAEDCEFVPNDETEEQDWTTSNDGIGFWRISSITAGPTGVDTAKIGSIHTQMFANAVKPNTVYTIINTEVE